MNEQELVEKAKNGDQRSFSKLMDSYMSYVYRLALRMLGNEMEAEDVTQEVFIKAYKSLKAFRGKSQFKTWLYRIAVNQSLKAIKKQKIVKQHVIDEIEDKVNNNAENPLDSVIQAEQKDYLNRSIKNLPPKQKAILLLRVNDEMSFKDIAAIMKRSVGAVKANYFHAIQNIQSQINGEIS
ncbi:RNA polymerase sigma factor [bacterium]|nr:RNA polymerase sigma factor [candidate division CSSED10-310 bacterium]